MALSEAIPGVILAGGLSSRMGQDKTRIRLGGAALIDRTARRLRPQVSSVAVNANGPVLFERGEEFPVFADLDAARAAAIEGVRSLLSEEARQGQLDLSGKIEIADADGNILLIVPFREAVELRQDG